MKKVLSIFLLLLMTVALLHISVAIHYCEGKEVASSVSLSGKLASCGMACSEQKIPFQGASFTNHCCDNTLTVCGINNNYFPSYSFVPELHRYNFQALAIPVELSAKSGLNIPTYTIVNPPGFLMFTKVDLSNICVFRI
jgi:hypothetical protein